MESFPCDSFSHRASVKYEHGAELAQVTHGSRQWE